MLPIVCRFKKLKPVLLVAFVVSLSACGGGDSNPVPVNSNVTLSSSDSKWEISPSYDPNTGACLYSDNFYVDEVLVVSVTDSSSRPLGDVSVFMTLSLAGNTFLGETPGGTTFTAPFKLYEDMNGNGVVDDPEELVSAVGDPFYFTRTDEYTGTKMIVVRVNVSCTYRGYLTVTAGSASARFEIEVKDPNA